MVLIVKQFDKNYSGVKNQFYEKRILPEEIFYKRLFKKNSHEVFYDKYHYMYNTLKDNDLQCQNDCP
jgi:hypothetical protein